jgi:hypothetical protein
MANRFHLVVTNPLGVCGIRGQNLSSDTLICSNLSAAVNPGFFTVIVLK